METPISLNNRTSRKPHEDPIVLVGGTLPLHKSYPVFLQTKIDGNLAVIPDFSNIKIAQNCDEDDIKYLNDCYDKNYSISLLKIFKYNRNTIGLFKHPKKAWEQAKLVIKTAEAEYSSIISEIQNQYIAKLRLEIPEMLGKSSFTTERICELKAYFTRNTSQYSNFKSFYTAIMSDSKDMVLSYKQCILQELVLTAVNCLSPFCISQAEIEILYNAINATQDKMVLPLIYIFDKFIARLKEYYIPAMNCGLYIDGNGELYITPRAFNLEIVDEEEYLFKVDRETNTLIRIPEQNFIYPGYVRR